MRIFILLLLITTCAFADDVDPRALLQITRPDANLVFRYCVPTTAEAEVAHATNLAFTGSLTEELIKKLPAGKNRDRIAMELRASEQEFSKALAATMAEFAADLTPEDRLYRYAYDCNGNQESGLLVVRNGTIRRRYFPTEHVVFPNLFPSVRYNSVPNNPDALLRSLSGLIRATGIVRKENGELLVIIDGKARKIGDELERTLFQRVWKPVISEIYTNSYKLSLGEASLLVPISAR